jgi:hypothetical protein
VHNEAVTTPAAYDPGSFRDRHARVFHAGGEVFRALDANAAQEWRKLLQTRFFPQLLQNGAVVGTREVACAAVAGLESSERWSAVLRHDRVPFVSYPYEWSFGMLKDAALLHLDIMIAALDEGMILKDSTPFNYQWIGTRPQLIDITSFASLTTGEPWVGYRQFCRMFLYPLLLEAYKGIPFQSWLRGSLEGLDADSIRRAMSLRDLLRKGVLKHVNLQSRLERSYAAHDRDIRSDLRSAGFHVGLLRSNVEGLRRLIAALRSKLVTSPWSEYAECHAHYDERDDASKAAFVHRVTSKQRWRLIWDLGCNTGHYSRIASRSAEYVLALDADAVSSDRLYGSLKRQRAHTILPIVYNVAEPSPALGWRNRERVVLTDRGTPDLTLCLALVHHLVIGAGIPLPELIDWLASLRSSLVIEFVTKQDPMVQRLLRHKEDAYQDYELNVFERCLSAAYRITERLPLGSGTRMLYFAECPA